MSARHISPFPAASPLAYAKPIATGLQMAEKARGEAAFWLGPMLRALGVGAYGQAHLYQLSLLYWLHEVDKLNAMTLELCRMSRMPMTTEDAVSTLPPPPEAL